MLEAMGNTLYLHKGDFGITLPFRVKGGAFLPTDVLRFSVWDADKELIHRDCAFAELQEGAFLLSLSAAETALLPVGTHLWSLTLLRGNEERNTIKGPCALVVLEA